MKINRKKNLKSSPLKGRKYRKLDVMNNKQAFEQIRQEMKEAQNLDEILEKVKKAQSKKKLNQREQKEFFLKIYKESYANISIGTKALKVPRSLYNHWISKDPKFKEQVDFVFEETLDFVESKLMEKIKNGSFAAIKFYLCSRGKNRGWNEDTNSTTVNIGEITPKINFEVLSDPSQVRIKQEEKEEEKQARKAE